MRRAYSRTDGVRPEEDPRADSTWRLLRLGVESREGETPSLDVLLFPCDDTSLAFCLTCLGVATSFLMELSMAEGK